MAIPDRGRIVIQRKGDASKISTPTSPHFHLVSPPEAKRIILMRPSAEQAQRPQTKKQEPLKPPASAEARRKGPGLFFSRRYRPIELISRGDRGPVYKAQDTLLDMTVAIKIFPDALASDPEAVSRFKLEARMAMGLSHDNIVRLHNLEVDHNKMFLVMEYVEGQNFRRILKDLGKLSIQTVLAVAESVCSALDHAHRRGVLHQDLKPENLMLNSDSILKIVDLGTAIPMRATPGSGVGDYIEGTPGYMSPEQARGEPLDARTDVFSLGATLSELLTGRPAFPSHLPLEQIATMEPQPMADVSEAIADVLKRAMACDKEKRWPTAIAFLEAFAQAATREDDAIVEL